MNFWKKKETSKKQYSIGSRFRFYNIAFFILAASLMILIVNFIFNAVTKTSSRDYARFYSTDTVNVLNIHLNREIALVTKVARSNALVEWFADELNTEKKSAAYEEMMSYADMLFNANLYFVINESLDEYSIDKGASIEEFVPFDIINPDIEYNQWYYRCLASVNDYTLNIDIDKVTHQRRLWINHKVMHKEKLLGVFCSSLLFNAVIDEIFSKYETGKVRGIVINELGIIQMDSTLTGDDEIELYEEGLRIQEASDDPVFLSSIDKYLGTIPERFFSSQDNPIIFELEKSEYSFASIAPIPNTNWTVVIFFNSTSLFNIAKLQPLLFALLAALIVYTVFITFLSRKLIFVPFQKLIISLDQGGINKNGRLYGYDLRNEFGEVSRTIQNVRDRLSIQNKELLMAMQNAEKASQAKSMFLSNMSHEMRTPMNVVVGLTDLMVDEPDLTINLKENLKKISIAGNTLLRLINDILDISKIEAGKLELMPVAYEVPSFLNDIITLNMIRVEEKPITFHLDLDENLPYSLYGDDIRLKQIINNLLSNAFKYTQKGTVTLGINAALEKGQDVRLSVYVRDTGIGIREEDMKKLFADYNQVDTKANRLIEGTGLGLAITKRLAEMMDGEITAESIYGKGSVFRLRIRQGYVSDKVIGDETVKRLSSFSYTEEKRNAVQKLERPDLSYARVLVVDDMQTNLDVASGMLRKYKMQVDCVNSGQKAVERIRLGEPVYNAVFMDHMMPGMDGIETTDMIRALGTEYAQKIPVIALTANAIAGNEQMFLNNNFQGFLAKPINMINLDSVIQKWVRNKSKEQMANNN